MKPKYDHQKLQEQRPLFFSIGLMLALLFVISAFEWKTVKEEPIVNFNDPQSTPLVITEIIPVTRSIPPRPKPAVMEKREMEFTKEVKPEEVLSPEDFQPATTTGLEDLPVIEDEKAEVFEGYETMPPSYVGGMDKFYEYLKENLEYPENASQLGIGGKVYLSFIVDETGRITNIKVVKGINETLDKAAIKALESSPKWNPGYSDGLPVKTRMQIPVVFSFKER